MNKYDKHKMNYKTTPRMPKALHLRAKLFCVNNNITLRRLVMEGVVELIGTGGLRKYLPLPKGERVKTTIVFTKSDKEALWGLGLQNRVSLSELICACMMAGMGE